MAYAKLAQAVPAFSDSREYPLRLARRSYPALRTIKIPIAQVFRKGPNLLIVYALDLPELPKWVFDKFEPLKQDSRIQIIIAIMGAGSNSPEKIASEIIRDCLSRKIGIAIRTTRGVELVLAPRHSVVQRILSQDAVGHIPEWLIVRLRNTQGFSPNLRRAIVLFDRHYARFRDEGTGGYDDECNILDAFARRLAQGDRRLFFPNDLLHTLRDFERSRANPTKRDHFFHTFNNLFLGFILLAECLPNRSPDSSPDRVIAGNGAVLQQHPWETLWALTCLFHDRGYIAEDFPSAIDHNFGLSGRFSNRSTFEMPDTVAKRIADAWDTEFASARDDLFELANSITRLWRPRRFRANTESRFQEAIRKIYFDGSKCGHSLLSGLTLINRCDTDRVAPHNDYDREAALSACSIAALSMVFHDPYARSVFMQQNVLPITFEHLPYAGALAFVDALQEDRRTIEKMKFSSRCILEDVSINPQRRTVTAKMNLRLIKLESWPWKVAEFAEVLTWLSRGSAWRFKIDYLSTVGGRQT